MLTSRPGGSTCVAQSLALERACRADLVDQEGKPLVSPHGLRRSCASIMLARGVLLIVVSRQLGHATPKITAQVYSHPLVDAQLDDAAAAFETLGPAEGKGGGGRRVASPRALTVRETVREEDIGTGPLPPLREPEQATPRRKRPGTLAS
jgi:Phage integrase family